MQTEQLEKEFEAEKERFISEWKELLSFPSISTERKHDGDCTACAQWLRDHLRGIGFEAVLLETSTKPVIFAERTGLPGKPTILFYGHYDVQPVDPLEKWLIPPFRPELKDGRMYARGAQDNKGQLFYMLKALETLVNQNALEPTVKLVIEGEEESGSTAISEGLTDWKKMLAADVLIVTDTNTVVSGAPTIIMGLRGLVHATVEISGPSHDLHSGVHGGAAPNPAQEIARLISSFHNADGSIAVAGFYDEVRQPTSRERKLANTGTFDKKSYQLQTGVAPSAGEAEFTPAERTGFRPSIDINGLHSGYDGDGVKTIIPARATAKITSRLVPDQDPARVLEQIVEHVQEFDARGLRVEITDSGMAGPGFRLDPDSTLAGKAARILEDILGGETVFLWEGASIPIIPALAEISGAEPLLVGFGSEEDNIHAPNESFSLDRFRYGYLYCARMLCSL